MHVTLVKKNHIAWFVWIACLAYVQHVISGQLVINVKNQGGDVLQETWSANPAEETVLLEFQRPDGILVTLFLDFKNELQLIRMLILGEEEQGQSQYQVLCFVFKLPRGDFVAADAIANLKQKNPATIRTPEKDRGRENVTFDLILENERMGVLSERLPELCAEASHSYARQADMTFWTSLKEAETSSLMTSAILLELNGSPAVRCKDATLNLPANMSMESVQQIPVTSCLCHVDVCIPWYPCGIKFCKGQDSGGKTFSYRCGIKTCRKCLSFEYGVQHRLACVWDS